MTRLGLRCSSAMFSAASTRSAVHVFTESHKTVTQFMNGLEVGMVNHSGMAHPELPFGRVKDGGIGSEGGTETFDGFLTTKRVTQICFLLPR